MPKSFLALSGEVDRSSKPADESQLTKKLLMPYAIYILKCSDGSYYTGLTREMEARVKDHQMETRRDSYTFGRRPVELVWYEVVESYQEAFQWEHQIKGWSRAKKEALIHGDIEGIHEIVVAERSRREKLKGSSRAERRLEQSESRRRSVNDQ